jgi:hypothetical protein
MKYKCFYYTNNKELLDQINKTYWIGIYDPVTVKENEIDSCFDGKKIKVLPHKYPELSQFHYTCFYDSKFGLINESFVEQMIRTYLIKKKYAFLIRKHDRRSIWDEFNESMKQTRYLHQKDQYIKYINKQLNKGLNETIPHFAQCNVIIRNMKHPYVQLVNNAWYKHIKECGIQDQLSFFFVHQMYDKYIYVYSDSPCKHLNTDWRCNFEG